MDQDRRFGEEIMMPRRVNVLGASGSGTSTVGRSLAHRLAIPHFVCDNYYHGPSDPPFQNPRTPDERHRLITDDLASDASWVLSGGIAGWEPYPELDFTLIVFLYVPTELRLERLRQRERQRFGARILEGGDMHEIHEEFIEWASHYDAGDVPGKTLPRHETWLKTQTCPMLEFRGTLSVSQITEKVLKSIDRTKNA